MHHNQKIDSPSGTAKMLYNTINNIKEYKEVNGRSGVSRREKNEIGVHSLRGGTVAGIHEVIYAGEDEMLSIKHEASSRKIFAKGMLVGAKWIINKENGLYDMNNVLFKE